MLLAFGLSRTLRGAEPGRGDQELLPLTFIGDSAAAAAAAAHETPREEGVDLPLLAAEPGPAGTRPRAATEGGAMAARVPSC